MSNFGFVTPGSTPAHIAHNARGVRQMETRAEIPGPWVYVLTGDPELDNGDSPAYQNGWTFAGPPFDYPAFRHGLDGDLEFKGHLDAAGAASNTVAFTLPFSWRIAFDVSWPTDVWDGGASFIIGRVQVEASSGDVTIIFPAS